MEKFNKEFIEALRTRFALLSDALQNVDETTDLYPFIASIMYNLPIGECGEMYPDGSFNPTGKDLRNRAKQFIIPVALDHGGIFTAEYEEMMDAKMDAANLRATLERCRKCQFNKTCEFNPSECEE